MVHEDFCGASEAKSPNEEHFDCCLTVHNKNTSSGKCPTIVKRMVLADQSRVIVVASLPTSQSGDVTANISIV